MTLLNNNRNCILLIIVLTVTAYSFMVSDKFKSMDDNASIVQNIEIQSFDHIDKIMTTSYFKRNVYYRPLVLIHYMFEYFFIGLNAFYYYISNILVHTATAVLLFFLINTIFRRKMLSLCVALLFAIHPIQWEAVSNIPGRAILLSTFFTLSAFYFFIKARENFGWLLLSMLCFILGLLSKESATMLVPLLLSYQFFFKRGKGVPLSKWSKPLFGYVLILAVYVLLRKILGITQVYTWNNLNEAVIGFITFLRGMITYLRLYILPWDLHFDRGQILFSNLFQIEVFLTLLFFALWVAFIYTFRKRISREAAFFLSWFCIEMIPVSQFWVTIGVQPGWLSMAEHFLYGASIGIFVIMCLTVSFLYEKNRKVKIISPQVFALGIFACYLLFFLATVQNCYYASNEIAMFERSLKLNPNNARIRFNLGLSYAKLNRFVDAEDQFRSALEYSPKNLRLRIALGKALSDQGKLWEGLREYESIGFAYDDDTVLRANIKANYQALAQQYQKKLKTDSGNAQIYYSLGVVYFKQDRLEEAVDVYKQAIVLNPNYTNAFFNLGVTYEKLGRIKEAVSMYTMVTTDGSHFPNLAEQAKQRLNHIHQ